MEQKNTLQMIEKELNKVTPIKNKRNVIIESEIGKFPYVRVSVIKGNVKLLTVDKNKNKSVKDLTNITNEKLTAELKEVKQLFN